MPEHHEHGTAVTHPPDGYLYAGPWIRFAALILDSVLFAVLIVALAVCYGLVRDAFARTDGSVWSIATAHGAGRVVLW